MSARSPYSKNLCDIINRSVVSVLKERGLIDIHNTKTEYGIDSPNLGMALFMGSEMSGVFSLHCDQLVLKESFPLPKNQASTSNLEDWLGELVNSVLGAIKSEITTYGIDIDISVPKIVNHADLLEAEKTMAPFQRFPFNSKSGNITAYFCAEMVTTIDFSGPKLPDKIIGAAGSAHIL